jgi:hypothetical protein
MATNSGHMTKLEAVNSMLWSIGESPVQGLSSGLGDAEVAEAVLDRVSRDIQLMGWHCNTLKNYEISKNAGNQFPLPEDTLKVDTVNPSSGRQLSTPRHSAFIDAVMRRSADKTKWILFDRDNNSETWTTEDTLTVDLVQFQDFANLTPALQAYVWTAAAHKFQKGAMGSRVLYEYSKEDVDAAMTQAVQEDTDNEDINLIRQNAHVRQIAYRNNPGFNR